jgi:hypothetical protein
MATKRSLAKASIDPGGTSLLASEDSKVMDTDRDENAMDDFSTLIFREPWLLEKISTFTASTWLSRKGIDTSRSSRFAARNQVDRDFQKTIMKKGGLIKEFHNFLYER